MSDRIAVMDKGRVLQVGTPEDVYERPATRFVADFLGEANLLDAEIVAGGARVAGVVVCVETAAAAGAKATLALRPERVSLADDGDGLPGVVEEVIYAGSELKYIVRLSDGQALAVRAPAEHPRRRSQHVIARFAPEHARILEPRP